MIKAKKPSLPFMLEAEKAMISTPTEIEKAKKVTQIKGLTNS